MALGNGFSRTKLIALIGDPQLEFVQYRYIGIMMYFAKPIG